MRIERPILQAASDKPDRLRHDEDRDEEEQTGGAVPTDVGSRKPPDTRRNTVGAPLSPPPLPAAAIDPDDIVPGEFLVLSENMAEAIALAQGLAPRGITVLRRQTLDFLGGLVLNAFRVPDGRSVAEVLTELRQDFPQLRVGPNTLFDPSGSQSFQPRLYARALIGWTAAQTRCGNGLRIGLVDTGLDLGHPALQNQRISRRSFIPAGVQPASKDHGTAIATLLVGSSHDTTFTGLLPGAELVAAEIFHMDKAERSRATTERIGLALDWLGAQDVRLVNLSLAGPENLVFGVLVERAAQAGMVLVAAAGNGGRNAAPAFPAAFDTVVSVTAVGADMKIYSRANRGDYIDFAAPGVDIWSARAGGGGSYLSGTSFAVPFVTAALATYRIVAPNASSENLRAAMRRRAKDLGAAGKDPIYGWGLIRSGPCAVGE